MLLEYAKRTPGRSAGETNCRNAVAPASMMASALTLGASDASSDFRLWVKMVLAMTKKTAVPMNWVNMSRDMAMEISVGLSTVWMDIKGYETREARVSHASFDVSVVRIRTGEGYTICMPAPRPKPAIT